jgi:hypothetical protein
MTTVTEREEHEASRFEKGSPFYRPPPDGRFHFSLSEELEPGSINAPFRAGLPPKKIKGQRELLSVP